MRMLRTTVLSVLAVVVFAGSTMAQTGKSLYERIGGLDAIAAVTDDFIPRLAGDPQLKQFFAGHSLDSQMKLRQHIVEFVCQATDGPCFYTGRDMVTAHKGLGITEAQWNVAANHFVATLDKFKVPATEKGELVALVTSLKGSIVEK